MGYKVKYEKVLPRMSLPLDKKDWEAIGGIVKIEIENGMAKQEQVTGVPYAPLKPETVKRKAANGARNPEMRLFDTQNLYENQVVTAYPDRVELTIGPTRDAIGYYQQEQPGPGNVPTAFFGISQNCSKRLLAYVDMKVQKWLSQKT